MAQVITFYSYKGGIGRSMALANVAWALATNSERVLVIDWDLEAPGLHRYFHPFLADPEQNRSKGLIDRVWDYVDMASRLDGGEDRYALARCDDIVQPLELPLPKRAKGCLHLLGAGRQDDLYSQKVGGLDWANFYERFDGRTFIDRLIGWARETYTHVLIDSRTGVADTAGICTTQLPDTLVLCLIYNRQSIEGSAAIARSILATRRKLNLPKINIHLLPNRVEERGKVDAARRHAALQLSKPLRISRTVLERLLRRNEIRHYPWCAFEEKLAVFEEVPDKSGSLLEAMHELARQLTGRKTLKIAEIDPALLSSIWRRAAFSDPRIADLEALDEVTAEAASEQLLQWLEEAAGEPQERADWLMALGEAAVRAAGGSDDRAPSSVREFFGTEGMRIAHRAYESDAEQYGTRFALLLQMRAAQLQKLGNYARALDLATYAVGLFETEHSATNRWRRARALERCAELLSMLGRADDALHTQRDAVEQYHGLGRRKLPLGGAIDPPRAMRVLAGMLLERGQFADAEAVAEEAVRQLYSGGETVLARNSSEVVRILTMPAEIAVEAGDPQAASKITKAQLAGHRLLQSSPAAHELDWQLRRIEADLLLRRGNAAEALAQLKLLDPAKVPPEERTQLTESIASALLNSGREQEAANMLIDTVRDASAPLTDSTLALLLRTLHAARREADMAPILLERLARTEPRSTALAKIICQLAEDDWARFKAAIPGSPSNDEH